jgi:hypothetical protein
VQHIVQARKKTAASNRLPGSGTFNVLDLVVVVASLCELLLQRSEGVSVLRGIRIFRLLRVLRVVRVFRDMRALHLFVQVFVESLHDFGLFVLFLFIFIYMFAVLGMQFFGDALPFTNVIRGIGGSGEGEHGQIVWVAVDQRPVFDDFFESFLTVFQVLTLENWPDLVRRTVDHTGSAAAAVYFVVWTLLGAFVLLELFLAIILGAFSNILQEEKEVRQQHLREKAAATRRFLGKLSGKKKNILNILNKQQAPKAGGGANNTHRGTLKIGAGLRGLVGGGGRARASGAGAGSQQGIFDVDIDGDGVSDIVAVDSTGDGKFDTFGVDTDGDGVADMVAVDSTGDGNVDSLGVVGR